MNQNAGAVAWLREQNGALLKLSDNACLFRSQFTYRHGCHSFVHHNPQLTV